MRSIRKKDRFGVIQGVYCIDKKESISAGVELLVQNCSNTDEKFELGCNCGELTVLSFNHCGLKHTYVLFFSQLVVTARWRISSGVPVQDKSSGSK